jgi:penicillin-binding protein 1C
MRPSRQPLRGFLRMRTFLHAGKRGPHAEERPLGRISKHAIWLWCAIGAVGAFLLTVGYLALPAPSLVRGERLSQLVLARDGSILRGFLSVDGKWRLPTAASDVDPLYRRMLIATEDRRFETHVGVDPFAVLRAAGQWITHGRVISGASTLTMQAVRLLERRPRTLAAKITESGEALALERRLGKDAILGLYLTLAPFGGNLEGVRAASLA